MCRGGGGWTGSTQAWRVPGGLGWLARRGCRPGKAREEWGVSRGRGDTQGGLLSRGASLVPPQAPLLLHISTFHASPPRMPNLAHAICRLSSEIGTGTKAECITSAPDPPALGEGGEGPRTGPGWEQKGSSQTSTFLPVSCLLFLP